MVFRGASTVSGICYFIVVLVITFFAAISCAVLLSQAIRTSPSQSVARNSNALIIGAAYGIVLVVSLGFVLKRRISVRLRLQRISKSFHTLGRSDVPKPVYWYIQQEYMRACLLTHDIQPKEGFQEGWGAPGTKYSGMRFRTTLLDTIRDIDVLAHNVIPRHPTLRPHTRMLHHFRFIVPLLSKDSEGFTPLNLYDSTIQLARHSSREPTEAEFIIGMEAAAAITRTLNECRLAMLEGSSTDLGDSPLLKP